MQLIAETIVDLVNEQETPAVTADIMEQALDEAIVRGHAVLFELMRGESQNPGEWEYLSAFRRVETQPPPEQETVYRSLRRREIMREETGAWRLAVPLMDRWLRKRG